LFKKKNKIPLSGRFRFMGILSHKKLCPQGHALNLMRLERALEIA